MESIMQQQKGKIGGKTQRYRLKSSLTPNQITNVIPFENDLVPLVENIIWRKTRNHSKKHLLENIN